jgi:hypothetical protein
MDSRTDPRPEENVVYTKYITLRNGKRLYGCCLRARCISHRGPAKEAAARVASKGGLPEVSASGRFLFFKRTEFPCQSFNVIAYI